LINDKTKLLILNYPNNPTGFTYSRQDLTEIYEVVKGRNIFVLSDEIYEALVYDRHEHVSFASLADAAKFTFTVNGFSKTFSMTGWRIGYLAGPQEFIGSLSKIVDHTTSCSSSISQAAALAALTDTDWAKKVKNKFQERRDCLYKGLSGLKLIKPFRSQGTFYMFCDIRKTGMSSQAFAAKLLEEELVSCIPADTFGKDGFLRLSFSTGLERIEEGVSRIKNFLKA
jgi:aspartate/methionine/tyrosine aminotransferase